MGILDIFNKQLILHFRAFTPWLLPWMHMFTFLGKEEFYLLVMPALYWCIDTTLGMRVGIILSLSTTLNIYLKWIFHTPRPYWLFPHKIPAYQTETSFGMPSGHAQNATVVWGVFAKQSATRLKMGFFVSLILFIGLSRLYLGVHSIFDILAGWLIGYFLLWAFTRYEKPVIQRFRRLPIPLQILSVFIFSVFSILTGLLLNSTHPVSPAWIVNAIMQDPQHKLFDPYAIKGLVSNAGVFFGLSTGAILLFASERYKPGGTFSRRLLQYIVGIIVVFVLWAGLKAILPAGDTFIPLSFRFLRYALVGFWISWGAPRTFVKIGIK